MMKWQPHITNFPGFLFLSAPNAKKAEPELLNWDALFGLVSFAQFKKLKRTPTEECHF